MRVQVHLKLLHLERSKMYLDAGSLSEPGRLCTITASAAAASLDMSIDVVSYTLVQEEETPGEVRGAAAGHSV